MTLAQPLWLIALILLPLMAVGGILIARHQARKWATLVAGRLRDHLIRRGSPIPRWLSFGFLLAAIGAMIGGLARPQGDGGIRSEKAIGRNLLLALDLSRSMRVKDVQPDRLALAKLVIYELLDTLPNDRIGLIGFAGNPYLYAPLTIDHQAVRQTVEQMDETWHTFGGSDLGAAVRLGIDTLKKTGQRNNAMVILTDGEMHRNDLDQMIAEAREAGVYILAIGVGTANGDYVPDPDAPDKRMLDRNGSPVISRLQSDVLRELANETKGAYAVAGSGADIPGMVRAAIQGLDAFELEGRERRVYIEFFQWLVLPAILLLIASLVAGTRWRGLAPAGAVGCLALLLSLPRAMAETKSSEFHRAEMERYDKLAQRAWLEGSRARYRLGEANAAYQLGDWNRASRAYSQALRSDNKEVLREAHHGMGNVLFQTGWLAFLEEPYHSSDEFPAMERFESAVRAKLAELKKGGRVRQVDPDDDTPPFSYGDIERAILDWSDAARHYQSVLATQPGHEGARQNRELTLRYLRRLQELLQEDEQKTMEMMPEPDDSGQPQGGDEGEPDPQGGDGNDSQQPQPGDGGQDPNSQAQPQPGDQDQNPPQPQDGDGNEDSSDESSNTHPGETPEDRARRILSENADLEKGPLTPGRIEFRRPEKDW